jgi:cGMP-dependent protein kinase
LLQILTPSQREALVGSLATLKFAPGEKIVKEGDPGDLFYIIKDGNVSCTKEGREIRTMTRGDFFGEQALLYHSPRTATIAALDDVKCVAIGRERLTRVLGNHLQQIIYRNSLRIALDRSHLMSKLNKEQSDKLFSTLQVRSAIEEDVIIPKGTPKGKYVWFVLKGSLKSKSHGCVAEQFSCFGEDEIVSTASTEVFDDDIISEGEVHFAQLSREEFETSIGGQYKNVTENNEAWSVLRRVQLLRGLSSERLQAIVRMLRIQDYLNGTAIVQQHNPGDSFFIIKNGKVDVHKDGSLVRTITKHDYFGERSVLFNDFRSATIVANGDVSCWVLQKSDFISIIDESIRVQLLKRIELQDDNITLDDLTIVKVLGKGMFGNVFLVVHKEKRSLYALKTVDRRKIERYEIQENLQLERKILLQLDHTFILKLVKTFKDQRRIYFLMEFVRGLDLFDVLRQLGLVTDADSRFYIASLIVILEHLHEREIIYRDLKPENVMVDEEGYPKLIDFGTAKIVQGRTYTIVGTPQYMAPEVILGKGYGVSADFWSIGVMLFEFLCGGVPFGEEEEDPYIIYEKVLEHKLVYPSWVDKKLPAKPMIEQLLSKNPAMRTGGSIENLKKHAWFHDFDWVISI